MSRWIDDWNPEDEAFWARSGRRVARRNLWWSILAENIGFSVWLVWSVTAPNLPKAAFTYTTDELFLLVALPGLVGALVRLPYTLAVPRFGGRNWTIVSALLLLLPTASLVLLVGEPQTPFWLMALAAASAGLGGGNFASSMANISFFFPDREKGLALGLNAAGGNLGVSSVQLLVPLVIGWSVIGSADGASGPDLRNAGLMWLPFIALAVFGASRFMDNLATARSNAKDQLQIVRRKHTWIMSLLYIGTFGSFVGYSAAFPLLLKLQFPASSAYLAFLGPLVGSIARPFGGHLADRLGGARVSFWNFVAMALLTVATLHFVAVGSFAGFFLVFLGLFVTTGIGNGSTFRMIPIIFRSHWLRGVDARDAAATERALASARREGAAVLGFTSAVGALGGFFIPRAFGASIAATGDVGYALAVFLGAYVGCIALTWWCYLRTSFLVARVPSLAQANA